MGNRNFRFGEEFPFTVCAGACARCARTDHANSGGRRGSTNRFSRGIGRRLAGGSRPVIDIVRTLQFGRLPGVHFDHDLLCHKWCGKLSQLFSALMKVGRRRACEDDGNSMPQWRRVEPILRPKRRSDGRGRPWQDTRAVLNGILWVLGTGAQWRELRRKYPPYQTCCPPPFSAADVGGQAGGHLACAGGGVAGPRETATGGGFHQRLLHGGKKRGLADLAERYGTEMIAPHRGGRRTRAQDGRPLRRYRGRWRMERLFAWLHHFRRVVVRWEHCVENFCGMVRLGRMANLAQEFMSVYSYRKATMGSTFEARRAGR